MIPSAESSCILVQAETVFILRESTTNTRHSILPGCLLWFFTVSRMTSFIIPEQIHQFSLFTSGGERIVFIICKHCCCVWPALTSHMITSGDGFGKHSFKTPDTEILKLWVNGARYLRCPTRFLRAMAVLVLFFLRDDF